MSLPSIDSEAQMSSNPGVWSLSAHSSATDFKLSLAPDVAEEVYKLIDLYKHGRARIAELERQYRAERATLELQDSAAAKHEEKQSPIQPRQAQRIMVRMSFTFNSGMVELNQNQNEADRKVGSLDLRGRPSRPAGCDIFTLPTISVWADYAGPGTDFAESQDGLDNYSVLVLNAVSYKARLRLIL